LTITKNDWIEFFPFEEPRQEQEEAIDFILDAYIEKNKRFVIADLGTGIGKSAIAITVARYLNSKYDPLQESKFQKGAWILTTQKILQEQYCSDFGGLKGPMKDIKSASNYRCSHFKKMNCGDGQQMIKAADHKSQFWKNCMFSCTYKKARKDFLESSESVTNFAYALTAANYGDKIKKRNLLVVDEAHNCESTLSSFIEIAISDRIVTGLGLDWPQEITTAFQAMKWIKEDYLIVCQRTILEMSQDLETYKSFEGHEKEYTDLSKRHDNLKSHVDKILTFLQVYTPDNWVYEFLPPVAKTGGKITFKPIDVSPFADQTLFKLGEKVLLMSATIINPDIFAESLGIDKSQYAVIVKESPFPVENRPVIFFPVGNMSSDHIDESLPKMVNMIKEVMKEHKDVKGILHCHNYRIANYLKKNLKSNRMIYHDTHDREEALEKHLKSKEPTILVSPSMSEGVDLRDDLARFQVLLKVPYPSLGDKLVKKRMNKWSWWYPMQTIKTIVQSVGRGVRSEKDHAVTYIFDSDWSRFYGKNKELFPHAFRIALQSK